jgi:hypothetical protein
MNASAFCIPRIWRGNTTDEHLLLYFINNQRKGLHCRVLSIELAQEIDVPGLLDVNFTVAPDIDKVVGVIAQDSPDCEWPLPW